MFKRFIPIAVAGLFAVGLSLGIATAPAHAVANHPTKLMGYKGEILRLAPVNKNAPESVTQICSVSDFCYNTWNGTQSVQAYTPNTANNDFVFINTSGDNWNISDTNPASPYDGDVVGNYGNAEGDARAGMDPLNGWGTNVYIFNDCSGQSNYYGIEDAHWGTWESSGQSVGAKFYLNTGNEICYQQISN